MTTKRGRIEIDSRVRGEREARGAADAFGNLEKRLDTMGRTMTASHIAANMLTKAIDSLGAGLMNTISIARNWEDWVGKNSKSLDGMSDAIDGMIDKLELSRTQTKLTTGEMNASQRQQEAVAKAAIVYARVNHEQFEPSLRLVTDAMSSGRMMALRSIGVLEDLTGTTKEKAAKALELLEERFGDVDIKASNANEKIAKMNASVTDSIGELTSVITQTDLWKDSMGRLATETRSATRAIEEFNRAATREEGWGAAGLEWAARTVGYGSAEKYRALIAAALQGRPPPGGEIKIPGMIEGEWDPLTQALLAQQGKKKKTAAKKGARRREFAPFEWSPEEREQMAMFGGEEIEERLAAEYEKKEAYLALLDQQIPREHEAAEAMNVAAEAARNKNQAILDLANATRELDAAMVSIVDSTFVSFQQGMLSTMDAAIQGQQDVGEGLIAMVKQMAFALSGQLFALGIAQKGKAAAYALDPFMWPVAAAYYASADTAFTWAAITAGIGLTTSAFQAGMKGGGGGGGRGASAGGGSSSYWPGGGSRERSGEQVWKPVINVYLDAKNPATKIAWRKQIAGEVEMVLDAKGRLPS